MKPWVSCWASGSWAMCDLDAQKTMRAWTFRTESGRFASAPMAIDGVMYFSAPNGVYAVDGATGTLIWKYVPAPDPSRAVPVPGSAADSAGTALRGPTYWPGGNGVGPRIYSTTTPGLAAIDAKTGKIVQTFGEAGVLLGIRPTSPAAIYKNVLIAQGGSEPGKGNTVKGWDVVTGKPLWTFYLKAQPGDPNRATWLNGSAESDASPGLWGLFTIDEERGTVFIPVEVDVHLPSRHRRADLRHGRAPGPADDGTAVEHPRRREPHRRQLPARAPAGPVPHRPCPSRPLKAGVSGIPRSGGAVPSRRGANWSP